MPDLARTTFVMLTAVGVAAALLSVRAGRPWAYGAAKALASLGFLGTALAAGAPEAAWTRLAVAALALSAVGDVALAVRGRGGFAAGLAAFLAAHLAYAAAFVALGFQAVTLLSAAAVVAVAFGAAWRWLRHGVPASLRTAVAAYVVVLGAMAATGLAAGLGDASWWLALGAVLVAGSDLAVARQRFVRPSFANKLVGLPAYYLGQVLIALAVAAARPV